MIIDWKNTDREFSKNELIKLLNGLEGKDEEFKTIMNQMGDYEAISIQELKDDIENETEKGKLQVDQFIKGKKMMKKIKLLGIDPEKMMRKGGL